MQDKNMLISINPCMHGTRINIKLQGFLVLDLSNMSQPSLSHAQVKAFLREPLALAQLSQHLISKEREYISSSSWQVRSVASRPIDVQGRLLGQRSPFSCVEIRIGPFLLAVFGCSSSQSCRQRTVQSLVFGVFQDNCPCACQVDERPCSVKDLQVGVVYGAGLQDLFIGVRLESTQRSKWPKRCKRRWC